MPVTLAADTLRFCTEMGNAELPPNNQYFLGEEDPNATSCSIHIWSTQDITDPCSGSVTYDVRIYPFDGVGFVQILDPTNVPLDINQQATLSFDTRSGTLPPDHPTRKNGMPYTHSACSPADGYHRLLWTVVNDCDETTIYEYLIRVVDCTKPIAVCVGLSSVVLPTTGSVTIWAKDFDGSSYDDCTPRDSFLFSFSPDEYLPAMEYSCFEFCHYGLSYLVHVWVADHGNDLNCDGEVSWSERNKDFCSTFVVFDDHSVCDCFGPGTGRVRTPLGTGIRDVVVSFSTQIGVLQQYITDELGYYRYQFINPLFDYVIEPTRSDEYKNGVSTIDLVLLQKHLLGLKPFDTPFEFIAADVNNTHAVSLLDLIEMRKLILGLTSEFPDNQSWRFVPEEFVFVDSLNPWPFPGSVSWDPLDDLPGFIGVKIGDLNFTAHLTDDNIQTRNANEICHLFTQDFVVRQGQQITVPIYSGESDLLGFQFTLNTQGFLFSGVQPGILDVTAECIGIHSNAITLSWAGGVKAPATSVSETLPLFTLSFTATSDGTLNEMLSLSSDITSAEAYRKIDVPSEMQIELLDVQLNMLMPDTPAGDGEYMLHQNTPNPFSDQTVIAFNLPSAMTATIGIFNAFGQEIHRITNDFAAGRNTVTIRNDVFNGPGVFCYYLKTQDFTAGKMLILSE